MGRLARNWCILAVLVSGLGAAYAPRNATAQAFAFSIGSGGYHHHHHRGWYASYGFGPWWGPGWYGPPPVVYAPPPVVQERVIYVQPQTPTALPPPPAGPYSTTLPPAPSLPPAAASLAASSNAAVAGSAAVDDRIVIRNSAGMQLPVAFLVDGQDIELNDGATRTFIGKTLRTVQYDRGGRYGSTQQDLTAGQYEFRITASGWDLARRADPLTSGRTAIRSNSLPESAVSR